MRKIFFAILICTVMMLSCGAVAAEDEYWITIDPIPDQMLGTTYQIFGETNLPVGSRLLFEHYWIDWECRGARVCSPPGNSGMTSLVIQVEQGTRGANAWRVIMNTSEFDYAREFLVRIYSVDTPARKSTTYNLLEPTPETPWITIDPIPDQYAGTSVSITGTVYHPQEDELLITIRPVWFDPNTAPDTAGPLSFVHQRLIPVPEGTTDSRHWNLTLDTAAFPPDLYRVEASGIDSETGTQNRTFLLHGNETAEDYTITVLTPEQPHAAGTSVLIRGSCSTGNAGTLLYELTPARDYISTEETRTGYMRTVPVRIFGKTLDLTTWETVIDTAGLKPGDYTLRITAPDAPVTAAATIELRDKQTAPAAAQTPGFGFGILALLFGAAVLLGTLRRT